jgi:hypothetical protein
VPAVVRGYEEVYRSAITDRVSRDSVLG